MTRAARHNETVELRASTFSGKDAEHAPSYVRIEGIEAKGARAGSAALQLRADDGSLTPVAENQEIAAADFGRLVWNSADNDGGSFRFVPLDSKRQPYNGIQPQTVNIYESPAVPDYASVRDPLAVAHDQTLTLGQELFAGNAADKAPSFIRIEKITPQGQRRGRGPAAGCRWRWPQRAHRRTGRRCHQRGRLWQDQLEYRSQRRRQLPLCSLGCQPEAHSGRLRADHHGQRIPCCPGLPCRP